MIFNSANKKHDAEECQMRWFNFTQILSNFFPKLKELDWTFLVYSLNLHPSLKRILTRSNTITVWVTFIIRMNLKINLKWYFKINNVVQIFPQMKQNFLIWHSSRWWRQLVIWPSLRSIQAFEVRAFNKPWWLYLKVKK